jgi:signal transduction histidine kinase
MNIRTLHAHIFLIFYFQRDLKASDLNTLGSGNSFFKLFKHNALNFKMASLRQDFFGHVATLCGQLNSKLETFQNKWLSASNFAFETTHVFVILNSIIFLIFSLTILIFYYTLKKVKTENESYENNIKVILHDLKSPISSYQGLADTISFFLKSKQFDKIDIISKKIDDYGIDLQRLLLDLNVDTSLKQEHSPIFESTTLINIIRPILQIYQRLANLSGFSIIENGNLEKIIFTNIYLFQTIFRNLLDNAIKNSKPDSSIVLTTSGKNNKVILSVTNYPTVIYKNEMEDLIRFLNSPETVTTLPKNGMGLSIIKKYSRSLDIGLLLVFDHEKVVFQIEIPTIPFKRMKPSLIDKLINKYA